MQRDVKLSRGAILVVTDTQSTSCGIKYLRKGSIIELAEDKERFDHYLYVYRNHDEKGYDKEKAIGVDKVRLATPYEIEMWNNKIYFVELSNVN